MIVSIIIPLYYGSKYITQISEMIRENEIYLKQLGSEAALEVILVNDSPDDEIILGLLNWKIYTNTCNLGIHASRVIGLSHATGDNILFLDQDDKITNNYIYSQLEHIKDNDAVVCNGYFRGHKQIYLTNKEPVFDRQHCFTLKTKIVSPGQVLIKKASIPNEWLRNILKNSSADDYFLWIVMLLNGAAFVYNNEFLYMHMEDGGNTSFQWLKRIESIKEVLGHLSQMQNINKNDLMVIEQTIHKSIEKYQGYARIEEKWNMLYKKGIFISDYIQMKKIQVAIYGYGVIGNKLMEDFKNHDVKVTYVVDQESAYYCDSDVVIYQPEDDLPYVDEMIVTPIFAFDEIKQQLLRINIGKIVSLEEVIDFLNSRKKIAE